MTPSLLAAVLDGRVIILDSSHARVMLLDAETERVWRACTGRTLEEIAASVERASSEVAGTLRDLAEAGLILPEESSWNQVPVAWV